MHIPRTRLSIDNSRVAITTILLQWFLSKKPHLLWLGAKLFPLAVHDLAEKVKFTDPLVNTKGYSFSMSDVRVFHDLSRILALFLNPNHKALLEPWRFNDTMTLPWRYSNPKDDKLNVVSTSRNHRECCSSCDVIEIHLYSRHHNVSHSQHDRHAQPHVHTCIPASQLESEHLR